MILNEGERKHFMSGVAAYMGALDLPNQITREQFDKAVKTLYETIPDSVSFEVGGLPTATMSPLRQRLEDTEDPVQDVSNDVRSSGILVFDQSKSGTLRFAHKSFMEFLIASVYGEYLSGKNRENSTALIASTHLTAQHLLRHPESVTFLGEILVSTASQAGVLKPQQPVARLLFNLIVMRPNACGFLARLRARMAVQSLKARAMGRGSLGNRTLFERTIWQQLAIINRPEMLAMLLLCGVFEFLWLGNLLARDASNHHPFFNAWLLSLTFVHNPWFLGVFLLGMFICMAASVTPSSKQSIPSVRLWFICCTKLGLTQEDIASVVGKKGVPEMIEYLGVEDRFLSFLSKI
jgi:hypothetical protein